MKKQKLQQLLHNYLNGQCSEEEIRLLEKWFDRIADPSLELSDPQRQQIGQKIKQDLQNRIRTRGGSKQVVFTPALWKYGVAAAIAFAVAVVLWTTYNPRASFDTVQQLTFAPETGYAVYENNSGGDKKIHLPDGSTVVLENGSSIRYLQQSSNVKREVKLTGNAFFDVVKDAQRPFYVYGNNVVTRVLGTSFFIRSTPGNSTIEVAVKTGRVHVYRDQPENTTGQGQTENNGVVLTPNQKVVYFISEDQWVTSLVEKPLPVSGEKIKYLFVFDDTPLQEIARRLEHEYNISIIVENEKVKQCTFTGDVSAMPLYDMLSVITKSIGATYEVRGTTIRIDGNGCE